MYRLIALLLFSALAFSQTTTPKPKPATPPAAKTPAAKPATTPAAKPEAKPAAKSDLPASAAVITVDGICGGKIPPTPPPECKTVITRAEFEKLADALDPNMPPPRRQQLADAYARMLIMSDAANQRGTANSPQAQQVLNFTRMQTLTQLLLRDLQKEAAKIPPADTEKYYNEHPQQFEQATLQRLFIPKTPPGGEKPPDEKTLRAEAEKLRAAAAGGGEFEKLQKQAYDDLGIKTPPPPTNAGTQRRTTLPPSQAKVFDLQPGQLSEVIDEPGGIYIFKVTEKKKLTLTDVTPEINRTLESERMRDAVENLTKNTKPVFNPEYFGETAGGPEAAPAGRLPTARPGQPPAAAPPAGAPPTPPPAKPPGQ